MIRPWFRHAAVPWKTTVTQTRASGENRVSTKPGVLQDDRLYPLPQPVREVPGGLLVLAGRADQSQAQVRASEERFGVLAGQALVSDDDGAGRWPVSRLAFQHLPGFLALPEELGVSQGEP